MKENTTEGYLNKSFITIFLKGQEFGSIKYNYTFKSNINLKDHFILTNKIFLFWLTN